MKNRVLSFFLILCMASLLLPSYAHAEDEGYLFFWDFEEDNLLWLGATFSRSAAYDGEFGIVADSPIGGPTDYGFASMIEYQDSVYLEEGLMYRLSFWARSDSPSLPENANALNLNGSTLLFEIFGLQAEWTKTDVYFTVPESRQYGLDMLLYTEEEASRIELDDLSLSGAMLPPTEYEFAGRQNLSLPYAGSETYYLPIIAYNEYDESIAPPLLTYEADVLPYGVSLNTRTGAITASEDTPEGSSMILFALLSGIPVASTTVTFSHNLIRNGDFEDAPPDNGWSFSSSPFSVSEAEDGYCLRLETPEGDDNCSYGILESENTVALSGGELYVFRARVRTTDLVPEAYLYTQNTAEDQNTSITVDIDGISGTEWSWVNCSIRPEKSGIYALNFRFYTKFHQPVYIDGIRLTHEDLRPNEIILSAPGHITRPEEEARAFPMNVSVLDQEGNDIDASVSGEVFPADGTVTVDLSSNLLWVTPEASGDYTLTVSTDDQSIASSLILSVTDEYLGDGGFETTYIGQWWAVGEPASMSFSPGSYGTSAYAGSRMAEITLNGDLAGLLTNSYSYYSPDETYVFHGMIKKVYTDISVDVTVVLSDVDGNYTYIASDTLESDTWWEVSGIFSPEDDLIGKLVVFFSIDTDQHDQRVLLDDLKIEPLSVYADDVFVSGAFTPDSVASANYTFHANFKTDDASIVRWYISDSENGNYTLIDNQKTLLITPEMLGSYLKAEIVPVSLIGGFVGESAWSDPRPVVQTQDDGDSPPGSLPTVPPLDSYRLYPRLLPTDTSGTLFTDTAGHWAETEIGTMEQAAIATGYQDNTFGPDRSITRAEFTALLSRSFNLLPRTYSGRFLDVSASDWYAGIVETCHQYGLINGIDASHFDPDAPSTREQIALMIMRAYTATEREMPIGTYIQFYDEYEMMPEAILAIHNASVLGIVTGMGNQIFSPKENATRAQAIVMLYRLLIVLSS